MLVLSLIVGYRRQTLTLQESARQHLHDTNSRPRGELTPIQAYSQTLSDSLWHSPIYATLFNQTMSHVKAATML